MRTESDRFGVQMTNFQKGSEKADIRAGRIPQDRREKPAKLSHKDRLAHCPLKFTKAKRQDDETIPSTDLAIPFFDYKSHISIDRKFRLIRKWKATDAAPAMVQD